MYALNSSVVVALLATASICSALSTSRVSRSTYQHNARQASPATSSEGYEYVIVGSGAGGGPLAARLALKGHRVLLIEAGDDHGTNVNETVPAFQAISTTDDAMRWDYFVSHYSDPTRAAMDSKITYTTPTGETFVGQNPPSGSTIKGIIYPRAGTLGGCGSHNAMVTIYPNRNDWSNIANITGDDSWNADAMRKYYELLEKCEYIPAGVGHGTNGWLGVDRANVGIALQDTKVLSQLFAAVNAFNNGIITTVSGLLNLVTRDLNTGDPSRDAATGVYQIPIATTNGARSGPRDFILSVANAVNADGSKMYGLDIQMQTLVTKILFDTTNSTPTAYGVEYMQGSSLYKADPRSTGASGTIGQVNATREVIISAGAFNTPQLLKLSGIGPKAELDRFQIPIVVDLPGVGTNLQDRYEGSIVTTVPDNFSSISDCTFGIGSDPCLDTWTSGTTNTGKGVYASNGLPVGVYMKSSVAVSDPDVFVFGGPLMFKGYFPEYSVNTTLDRKHWTWAVLKAHTENKAGTVMLQSSDPRDTPVINFNYFDTGTTAGGEDERDLTALTEGMAFARSITQQHLPPLSATNTEEYPGATVASTDDLRTYARNEAWGHHASCTCPIGADGDPNAVLDSEFRVRGVKNLRVVDASIFPAIPGIFIVVPVYMISEKAADVISAGAV